MDGDHCTVDGVEVLDRAVIIPSRLFDWRVEFPGRLTFSYDLGILQVLDVVPIPRRVSRGTRYCFCLTRVAPGLRSTTKGAWFLAKPGRPFSAQTSGNSFTNLGGFICSLLED